MRVTYKCGMVVSDHDNAMREHLKSHAHGDRVAKLVFATAFDGLWVGASRG